MEIIDFNKNNLGKTNSPYLRQHSDNPIHWQEWRKEILDYAQKEKKLIFVSVGYATCHWCHVMAKEAFSDHEIASFLNKYFVSIKVDREQRPDIDQHLMNFLTETQGGGGWPMNVILTPDQKPFFAGTYFPLVSTYDRPGFKQILEKVRGWYLENSGNIKPYAQGSEFEVKTTVESDEMLLNTIRNRFDIDYGGWGGGPKFPPSNTLLFLLSYYTEYPSDDTRTMIIKTLDNMMRGGLHDHLRGGFFRYCSDRKWKIPHFEKMLYDQAMLLWVYSLSFKAFGDDVYRIAASKIVDCLDMVFVKDDVYYSSTDADTHHEEGATYLWSQEELKESLSAKEWQEFIGVYDFSQDHMLDGKWHLVKKENNFLQDIEQKLLKVRDMRAQPEKDQKIITSWNALLGIAFLVAGRYLKNDTYKSRGLKLYQRLIHIHWDGETLAHSSFEDHTQKQPFLEDYASLLLLATYVYEENSTDLAFIKKLRSKLMEYFKEGSWMESTEGWDFKPVAASSFDSPTPSSISLAEEALRRSSLIIKETDERILQYKMPLASDFYNLTVFYKQGNFHEIHSPQKLLYSDLPFNGIQLRGQEYQDCYKMVCRKFKHQKDLLDTINKTVTMYDVDKLLKFRKQKDGLWKNSADSPLTEKQKESFSGLSYFPPNPEYYFELTLDKNVPEIGSKIVVETTGGDKQIYLKAGKVKFGIEGESVEALVFEDPDQEQFQYYLLFRDKTTSKETYKNGRMLQIPKKGEQLIVDFNYAYNPYSAYNNNWDCPITPIANILPLAIRAGEKILEQP